MPHRPSGPAGARYGPRRGQFAPTAAPVSPTYAAIAISTGSELVKSIGSATGIAPRIMIDALLAPSQLASKAIAHAFGSAAQTTNFRNHECLVAKNPCHTWPDAVELPIRDRSSDSFVNEPCFSSAR